MKIGKTIFNVLSTILLVFLLAVVVLMFNARLNGEAPSIFGYQVFRVSSGSMEPELMIGDVILVKEAEPQDVKKGDIVTYKGEQGDLTDKFITHKVIEEPILIDGEYVFKTQGIVEGAVPDPEWGEDQLLGEFVCKLGFIDKLYTFFLKPYGLISFILIIIVLFGYELISLVLSYKNLDEYEYEEKLNKKLDRQTNCKAEEDEQTEIDDIKTEDE